MGDSGPYVCRAGLHARTGTISKYFQMPKY